MLLKRKVGTPIGHLDHVLVNYSCTQKEYLQLAQRQPGDGRDDSLGGPQHVLHPEAVLEDVGEAAEELRG